MRLSTRPFSRYWPLLVALLTLVLDQVSKFFIVRYLGPEAPRHVIPLLGSFVRLLYLENTGVSFGRLQGFSVPVLIFTTILVVILLVAYRSLLTPIPWANLALGLVIGGALGNLANRLITGLRYGFANSYVVDFVAVGPWPVFNVADSAITVGGILYGVYLVFFRPEEETDADGEEETAAAKDPAEQNKGLPPY